MEYAATNGEAQDATDPDCRMQTALQSQAFTYLRYNCTRVVAGGKRQDGGSRPVSQCAMDDEAAGGAQRKSEQPLKKAGRMRRFRNSIADFFGTSKVK